MWLSPLGLFSGLPVSDRMTLRLRGSNGISHRIWETCFRHQSPPLAASNGRRQHVTLAETEGSYVGWSQSARYECVWPYPHHDMYRTARARPGAAAIHLSSVMDRVRGPADQRSCAVWSTATRPYPSQPAVRRDIDSTCHMVPVG